MRGFFLLTIMLFGLTNRVTAQTANVPQPSSVTVKKILKVGGKWYVETNTTTKAYAEVNTQMLLAVNEHEREAAQDSTELARAEALKKEKQADRIERNKLLKDALKKGYVPQVNTIEDVKRVDAVKKKLGM